jgi:uncharacterized protein (DUF1697 family)
MTKYVTFLRAINVGGTKIIKMVELRKMFDSFGFGNVQTYIQSGNVIFETKASPTLEAKIERQLEEIWGQKTGVFLRSMEEIESIANQSHLKPKGDETLHVAFLREKPTKAMIEALKQYNSAADEFVVIGREVYNLRHDRDRSIFSNNFIEKIFSTATTRNMTTIQKILEKYR